MAYAAPVTAVNTSNVNIAAPGSGAWDGQATSGFVSGTTRLLCVGQTNPWENGVYIWHGTANPLQRPTAGNDQYATTNTLDNATLVPVASGNTYGGTCWGVDPAAVIKVDTTSHTLSLVSLPPVQVAAASTGSNINLSPSSALTSLDGVTLVGNGKAGSSIILAKDQTAPSQNGLYWANTSSPYTLNRCTEPLTPARKVQVSGGTINAYTEWLLNTAPPITVGTTSIGFSRQILRANVMDFGAVGTGGVTSDSTAIANAIASVTANNGTVVFPRGEYLLGSSVTFPANVQLVFERVRLFPSGDDQAARA